QRSIVSQQCLSRGSGNPVRAFIRQIHSIVTFTDVIGAESRALEMIPIHVQLLPASINAVAEFPEVFELPRRNARHTPGPVGAPVVVNVPGEHRIALVESFRADGIRIIPSMPHIAGPVLSSFPAQVLLLGFTDLVGGIAEELRVPLCEAEFPWHL